MVSTEICDKIVKIEVWRMVSRDEREMSRCVEKGVKRDRNL